MKPRIIFLMMQYPDVDHLVPVADLLADTGHYDIRILTYQNRIDFDHDPRILYLKQRHGIVVRPLAAYYPVSATIPWKLYQWRVYWGKKCKDTRPYFVLGRNLKSIFMPRFHMLRFSRIFVDRILSLWLNNRTWGKRAFEEERPSVVVIDHAYCTPWIDSFIRRVKAAGIPTISFPHSSFMFTHTHVLHNEKGVPLETRTEEEFPWDCVIVESGMRKKLLSELGVSFQKMFPLGCIRFTDWWIERHSREENQFKALDRDDRPIVVYLASGPSVTLEKGIRDLRESMLKYKNRIRFIVKVHSRRDRTDYFKAFYDCGIEVVGGEISSPTLIDAADYIIITASSVIIHAMLKKKAVVYAQFTTDNEPLFHKYGVFPAAHSANELEGIFEKMANKEWSTDARRVERSDYLKECVYGGYASEESLLSACLELFSKAANAGSTLSFSQWMEKTRLKMGFQL